MNIGDTIVLNGITYTVWLIEGNIYHLEDADGNGRCYVESALLTLD
jgi:hypothetical protein